MSDMENSKCDHGVTFDEVAWKEAAYTGNIMTIEDVRKRWPRGFGLCPRGCGFYGIAYASYIHYLAGDW